MFNTLPDIPLIGLGTYKLKSADEIYYSMEHAIKSGYRMFDTAELYKNEHHISYFIKNKLAQYNLSRNDIWITTKISYSTILEGEIPNIRKIITNSIELFEGYVDLFLIHSYNPNDVITWNILREYQQIGKIRYLGLSNYNLERLTKFIQNIGNKESKMIYANQIEYNPFLNRKELLEYCHSANIRIIAYGSLNKSNNYIEILSKKYSRTPEQILLQWANGKGIIVIPMSRNSYHIESNISALENKINTIDKLETNEIEILDNLNENYTKFKKHL